MNWDQIIYGKFLELKKDFLDTLSQINIWNVALTLGSILAILFLLLFLIKILTRKFKELEEVRGTLRKLSFQLIYYIFWKQLPGGFASFMASLSLFFLMLKILKAMDFIIVDVIFIRHSRKEVLQIFRDIVKAMIWLIIILIMLKDIFGFSIQDIAITSAVVTAAFAFAFQDTLVNLIAGISISVEKSFKLGDFVQLKSGEMGYVIQTSWRTTRIKNRKNQIVVVPNKELASAEIINYNYYNQAGRVFSIGLAYKDSPYLIKKAIKDYLQSIDEVLKHPAPDVYVKEFQDFSILYEIRYYIQEFDKALIIDDKIKSGLWFLLKRLGLEVPFPVREVYQHPANPEPQKENIFMPEENLSLLLPLSQIIQIKSGQIAIIKKGGREALAKLSSGSLFAFDAGLKDLLGEKLLLTPLEPSVCDRVELTALSEEEKTALEKSNARLKEIIGSFYESVNGNSVIQEKRFIEHFMNINFNRDEK